MKYNNGGPLPPGNQSEQYDQATSDAKSTNPNTPASSSVVVSYRTCIVWKDKTRLGFFKNTFDIAHRWQWQCRICKVQGRKRTWKLAYAFADHHARHQH